MAIAGILARRRGGAFDLGATSPALWLRKGDFSASASPDVWTATAGTNVTGADDTGRTDRGDGVPRGDFVGSVVDVKLTSAQVMPGIIGERHYAARMDLRGPSLGSRSAPDTCTCGLRDSGGFTGLAIARDGFGPYTWWAIMWDYAGAAYRIAEVEITSLLNASGYGSVTVQGRKRDTGGGNWVVEVRSGLGSWVTSASYTDATDSTSGTVDVMHRAQHDEIEAAGWASALSDAVSTDVATYLGGLT